MRPVIDKLARFIKPKSIAVYGGAWAENVIQQLVKSHYSGEIWPVHPTKKVVSGVHSFSHTDQLPMAPDAAFVGVNRVLSIDVVRQLSRLGAGGAICFASGFSESDDARNQGASLQNQLICAAGEMPLLGPNCYGYLNYLDNVSLWPDQHGGQAVDSGVAIIAQSSNVAINLTMQKRGLSLAYMFTVGNQASVGINDLAEYAIADPRVSAIGLFIEGFGDLRAFESMSRKARLTGKSIVALKLGKSMQAQQATMTHTATLAGGSVAASALLNRLGIVEVDSLSCFIETLKLLDIIGPLSGPRISSVSCSGGEASLVADAAHGSIIEFPDLDAVQRVELLSVLGSKVTLANPLDYHTYVWGDGERMTDCFASIMRGDFDLNVFVLDIPRRDSCDIEGHRCAIESIINAKLRTGAKVAVITSLPENIDESITREFHHAGIAVLHGLERGLEHITSAVRAGEFLNRTTESLPLWLSAFKSDASVENANTFSEAQAKAQLAHYGVLVPRSITFESKLEIEGWPDALPFPVALKGLGIEHKSESGGVILGIENNQSLAIALAEMPDCPDGYLLEQMIEGALVEIIVGVTRDDTGLLLLTLGSGGVLTELLSDCVSVLMPVSKLEVDMALRQIKASALIDGYRGSVAANRTALINTILAIQRYVLDHSDDVLELDVNPLIVREHDCYAVDALIRLI